MVGIIIASHGKMCEGIFQSGSMIFGDQPQVAVCSLMPSEGPDDLRAKVEEAIASFDDQEEILFLVDLFGGTPYNQINGQYSMGNHDLLTKILREDWGYKGIVMTDWIGIGMDKAHDIAAHIVGTGRDGVKVLPESLDTAKEEAAPAASNEPTGAIPEGTVLGDGHIKYVLARIDTRLLHGQVATAWTKATQPTRIIAVSDNVAKDALRKQMIEQAAPPGVKANVVPIDKMCKVDKDPRFGSTKALLLFETPQDALKAIEGGVQIKELNLGSMAHSEGKVVCTKAVAMGPDDVKTFEKLRELGVKIVVRKVPADAEENFDAIMKKAKAELGL